MQKVAESAACVQFDHALRAAANRYTATYPTHETRIQRGLEIALSGGVLLQADGVAIVASQTYPGEAYHVNGRCGCPDEPKAPKGYCKHRYAKSIYKAALADVRSHAGKERWYATYTAPDGERHPGIASWDDAKQCWLFIPEDGTDPLYPAMQALSLGGHIATEQAQREIDGDLAAKVGRPQYPPCYADADSAIVAAKAAVAARQAQRASQVWGR